MTALPGGKREDIRAWRQALLWLLRSAYLLRMAVAYVVMVRGRHADPDAFHLTMTITLFVDLAVFLVAFFEYFPTGRRVVILESVLRVPAMAAVVIATWLWTARPEVSLGRARGPGSTVILAWEFLLAPLAVLFLVRLIGGRGRTGAQPRAR